jgi:hypothetical protein
MQTPYYQFAELFVIIALMNAKSTVTWSIAVCAQQYAGSVLKPASRWSTSSIKSGKLCLYIIVKSETCLPAATKQNHTKRLNIRHTFRFFNLPLTQFVNPV